MDLSDAVARQRTMTKQDNKSIQRTYFFTVFSFSEILGPDFTPENYPKTAAFFTKLGNTASGVILPLKNYYKRLRPIDAHQDLITLMVRNEPGYSYPSGHATRSRLFALAMAEIVPQQRAALMRAAERVGLDRILGGEHYATDLEGGRKLGKILFLALNKDPQFREDLDALKAAEWSQGLGKN